MDTPRLSKDIEFLLYFIEMRRLLFTILQLNSNIWQMEGKRTIESAGHSISSSSKLGLEFTLKSKPDFLAARYCHNYKDSTYFRISRRGLKRYWLPLKSTTLSSLYPLINQAQRRQGNSRKVFLNYALGDS